MINFTAGRPCSCCQHPSRATIDAQLASGLSNRRVARTFHISEASVRRHKANGHVAEAQRAQENAREVHERVAEHDAALAKLSFSGDLRQQAETLRDHSIQLLRRCESTGDTRGALAAASQIAKAIELLATMDASAGGESAGAEHVTIIHPPGWEVPDWLADQLPMVSLWLPDNGRGDGPVPAFQHPAEPGDRG